MQLADIISRDLISLKIDTGSRKRTLELISELIAAQVSPITTAEIFESLMSREQLCSTGIGRGVALPHGRMKNLDHSVGAFVRLKQGIDFDALDKQVVDMFFALAIPEDSTQEHLEILAKLAEIFNNPALREDLRHAESPVAVMAIFSTS